MADKSFSLMVELQADIDKFKKRMDEASLKNKDFSKKADGFNRSAGKGFDKMSGNVSKLSGTLGGLGGVAGQVSGAFGEMFGAITGGAGKGGLAIAAIGAAIGLITKAVKDAKKDIDAYSKTLLAMDDGVVGQRSAAKAAWKAEKSAIKGQRNEGRKNFWWANDEETANEGYWQKNEAQAGLKNLRGVQDKEAWIKKYSELQVELNALKREEFDVGLAVAELEYQRSIAQKDMRDEENKTVEERQQAYTDYVNLTNQIHDTELDYNNRLLAGKEAMFEFTTSTVEEEQELKQIRTDIQDIGRKQEDSLRKGLRYQKSITLDAEREAKARKESLDATLSQIEAEKTRDENTGVEDWMLTPFASSAPTREDENYDGGFAALEAGNEANRQAALEGMNQAEADALAKYNGFLEELETLTAQAAAHAITDTVFSLFEGLASGEMDNLFDKILSSFGNFMVQIGGMFIAYGIAESAFIKSLQNPTPAGAAMLIGAGVALVAIGGAISGAQKSFASGGGGGAYSGGSGYNSSQSCDNTVRFEIEGDKLVGALDNHSTKNNYIR